MQDSDLLNFDPVPVRPRRDGWTPGRQYSFILALAGGLTATKAAALVGMTRKTAYELRAKPGGEGFARAWAMAAEVAASRRKAARASGLAEAARQGEWYPRLYQGRLIGWEHRPANERSVAAVEPAEGAVARRRA
jgi:hypothetical protein